MSAFVTRETQITDVNLLREALQEKGFSDVEVHEEATELYGIGGQKRPDKAEVIIRRKYVGAASNDIGFKRNKNGNFDAIISQFDLGKYGDKWLNSVKESYSKKMVVKTMKAAGATKLSEKVVNGKTRMQYTLA